jgi:hypothetical protein
VSRVVRTKNGEDYLITLKGNLRRGWIALIALPILFLGLGIYNVLRGSGSLSKNLDLLVDLLHQAAPWGYLFMGGVLCLPIFYLVLQAVFSRKILVNKKVLKSWIQGPLGMRFSKREINNPETYAARREVIHTPESGIGENRQTASNTVVHIARVQNNKGRWMGVIISFDSKAVQEVGEALKWAGLKRTRLKHQCMLKGKGEK